MIYQNDLNFKNYVSKDEVELAYANYQQALAEVESAKAEVNASQATLNNNKAILIPKDCFFLRIFAN